jgi:hypothetical protein
MRRPVRQLAALAVSLLCPIAAASCDSMSTLGGTGTALGGAGGPPTGPGGSDGGDTSDGGGGGDDGSTQADAPAQPSCVYKDDKTFCACLNWNCGGATAPDNNGTNQAVYCGACQNTQYCQPDPVYGAGVGTCGGTNPLTYAFQKEKIDMLVSMGENDNTVINYGFAQNIKDGRGYTVGKVGFCTGTGDFIVVAACYNDLKKNNILSKYWGHRDATGKAIDGLIYYNDQFVATGQNQGDTTLIDKLGSFVADVATAAAETDGIFRACQDSVADAFDLAPAAQHVSDRGFSGALTIGFLYDTELNFGDDDDTGNPDAGVPPTPGAKTVMARADADYGDAGLSASFSGKPWEESKWLGYFIKERALVMAGNATWRTDIDQNATWEAARRLHTGKSNTPETDTVLDMDYDLTSEYKAGSSIAGAPCWTIPGALDSASSIYVVSTDKTASATDETKWTAKGTLNSSGTFAACPANPTP